MMRTVKARTLDKVNYTMRPGYFFLTIILVVISAVFLELRSTTSLAGTIISTPIEPAATQATSLQDGPSLLESHCAQCHLPQQLEQIRKPRAEWEKSLAQMEAMGVQLEDAERVVLLDYLAALGKP